MNVSGGSSGRDAPSCLLSPAPSEQAPAKRQRVMPITNAIVRIGVLMAVTIARPVWNDKYKYSGRDCMSGTSVFSGKKAIYELYCLRSA